MIPKIIHYCWFGGNPLSNDAIKCIKSWERYFPDYVIREWNESEFDFACCDYVKEAYEAKKWAFVSDYARFWILYNYGGIYFDTDVEVIAPMDDIIQNGAYMGCESDFSSMKYWEKTVINSGLGFGVEAGNRICKEMLELYENSHFVKDDGSYDLDNNVVARLTNVFCKYGFDPQKNIKQHICNVTLYPIDYFCPKNYYTNELVVTKNTRSIHHYSATWLNKWEKRIMSVNLKLYKTKPERALAKVIILPLRVLNKIETIGLLNFLVFIFKKFIKRL